MMNETKPECRVKDTFADAGMRIQGPKSLCSRDEVLPLKVSVEENLFTGSGE